MNGGGAQVVEFDNAGHRPGDISAARGRGDLPQRLPLAHGYCGGRRGGGAQARGHNPGCHRKDEHECQGGQGDKRPQEQGEAHRRPPPHAGGPSSRPCAGRGRGLGCALEWGRRGGCEPGGGTGPFEASIGWSPGARRLLALSEQRGAHCGMVRGQGRQPGEPGGCGPGRCARREGPPSELRQRGRPGPVPRLPHRGRRHQAQMTSAPGRPAFVGGGSGRDSQRG